MRICIYCVELKDETAFNSEHVVCRGLGTPKNSFTLDCVCLSCNDRLGKDLETPFLRGSFEGFLRYSQLLRRKTSDIRSDRLELRIASPPEWRGVIVALATGQDGLALLLPTQIGFRRDRAEPWTCIPLTKIERALDRESVLPPFARHQGVALAVFADSDPAELEARSALERLGFRVRLDGPFGPLSEPLVEVRAVFDEIVRRSIAKVAFNYAAHELGADFVLQKEFDLVRRYVRWGDRSGSKPVVRVVRAPMLADESEEIAFDDSHLVGLKWDAGDANITSSVSLFNTVHYVVTLAPAYRGLFRPDLSRGHRFRWREHQIEPLRATRLWTPPAAIRAITRGMF